MTSHKKCAIVYTRKQEPHSSLEGEADLMNSRCRKRGGVRRQRFRFSRSRTGSVISERAAQLAEYQTGSEVLREVQTDTKGASPMGTLDIKSGSHRLGGLQY